MVAAIGSESCLMVTSCALAPMARLQANARVAVPIVSLIMMVLLVPGHCGLAGNRFAMKDDELAELVLDLVDAGLRADLILVAARGAGDADCADGLFADHDRRSEERRVGKECRSRWVTYHRKQTQSVSKKQL